MEPVGTMSEGEWSSLSGMYSTEEADFMAQLLGNCSLPSELPTGSNYGVSSGYWPSHESSLSSLYSSDDTTNNNTNMHSFSQGSSYSGGISFVFPSSGHENYFPIHSSNQMMDYFITENKNGNLSVMEGVEFLNQDTSNDSMESDENLPENVLPGKSLQLGREQETPMPEETKEGKISSHPEGSRKRPRIPTGDKNKRAMRQRKNQKLISCDENDREFNNNAVVQRQSSSSCCSEDESNASYELNGGVTSSSSSKASGALNSNGKTRACRGSATDPQSLYARKRRERINERLRILQNLVPNGTKVDISTMLEEAVQYVKFLQLQIKLLSSDELWMYAPIAYNGMDIGLDLKINAPKS